MTERWAPVAGFEPFAEMARELFAQNWNRSDVVLQKAGHGGTIRTITAGDFFDAHAVLQRIGTPQDRDAENT